MILKTLSVSIRTNWDIKLFCTAPSAIVFIGEYRQVVACAVRPWQLWYGMARRVVVADCLVLLTMKIEFPIL